MKPKRLGMSQLAREAGFGARVWSDPGYWGGRFYYVVVAAGTAAILIASTIQLIDPLLLVSLLGGYGLYLFARFHTIRDHEAFYYRPWIQFGRAQITMGLLTVIIAHLGEAGTRGQLWLLYALQLIIIGRHLSTRLFLACVLEVWILLTWLRLMAVPAQSWITFIQTNPDLVVQWTWVALIGFILYYLLRNIDARNETIATMNQINALADSRQSKSEMETRWEAVLETYLSAVGGRYGSVWLCNQHNGEIRPLANLSHCRGALCPAFNAPGSKWPISLDADHPIAEVMRTDRPLYCRTQATLGDYLSGSHKLMRVCALPKDIYARILVPIGDQFGSEHAVVGVLCIDFDRKNPPRQQLLDHYFEFMADMGQRVLPILQFILQTEEQQTLRQIGVQVSSNLRLTKVLNDALDALTGPLGFELATISLVDKEANLIRCVAGRNVPQAWIAEACHPLDSTDIQADIVRGGKMEVIKGMDDRFDRRIYRRFHHDQLIRVFAPICKKVGDTRLPLAQGVIEVGYNLRTQDHIPPTQLAMLSTFTEQVAIAIENAQLFESTLQHRELLAQLHRVSHNIAYTHRPDDVLEKLGQSLQCVLKADIVMIYRFNQVTQTIDPPQIFGEVWGRSPLQTPPLDRGVIAKILHTGQPHYAADAPKDPLLSESIPSPVQKIAKKQHRTFTLRQNIKSFAGVPMLLNDEAVGVLCVNYRRRHAFNGNEQCALGLAAQLAAVALRNAELNAVSAELAAREERNRLCSQLHDSISQYLPAIQLMSDTALKKLRVEPDQASYWLERIQDAAQRSMTEVRTNLFEMRVSTTQSSNLLQALLESAELAREYFNLEVDIVPQNVPGKLDIPIETELLLVCREAIVNAGRHAQARRVSIKLSETSGQVCLQVQDDGCGFNLSALSRHGRRGLELMRQRIERMRGHLSIKSVPGKGTIIEAIVPI